MNNTIQPHVGAKFETAEEAPMIVFTICSQFSGLRSNPLGFVAANSLERHLSCGAM